MKDANSNDLLLEYHQKIEEFLKFDELNMKDTQMSLPAIRHYWVGRLMHHKQQIFKFKKAREKAIKALREKIQNEAPVMLSSKTIQESIDQNDVIQKIDEEIATNELLVEYLSKVEMNFRDAQYGLNNLTKIITLETT
jgi:hypothetical protein